MGRLVGRAGFSGKAGAASRPKHRSRSPDSIRGGGPCTTRIARPETGCQVEPFRSPTKSTISRQDSFDGIIRMGSGTGAGMARGDPTATASTQVGSAL